MSQGKLPAYSYVGVVKKFMELGLQLARFPPFYKDLAPTDKHSTKLIKIKEMLLKQGCNCSNNCQFGETSPVLSFRMNQRSGASSHKVYAPRRRARSQIKTIYPVK